GQQFYLVPRATVDTGKDRRVVVLRRVEVIVLVADHELPARVVGKVERCRLGHAQDVRLVPGRLRSHRGVLAVELAQRNACQRVVDGQDETGGATEKRSVVITIAQAYHRFGVRLGILLVVL